MSVPTDKRSSLPGASPECYREWLGGIATFVVFVAALLVAALLVLTGPSRLRRTDATGSCAGTSKSR